MIEKEYYILEESSDHLICSWVGNKEGDGDSLARMMASGVIQMASPHVFYVVPTGQDDEYEDMRTRQKFRPTSGAGKSFGIWERIDNG